MSNQVGVYEKVLPTGLAWDEIFNLVRRSGYDFFELAIDETAERQARLKWTDSQRQRARSAATAAGVTIGTVALSAHRSCPLGSTDAATRRKARALTHDSIKLAADLGAERVQIAGYYTYYEPAGYRSRTHFIDGLAEAADFAEHCGIVLAIENVDGHDVLSAEDGLSLLDDLSSPAVRLYVDVGNFAGNRLDVVAELRRALPAADAVQLKDALPGKFRRVPFGSGTVPFKEVLLELDRLQFHNPLAIEMWNDDANPDLASDALKWLGDLQPDTSLARRQRVTPQAASDRVDK